MESVSMTAKGVDGYGISRHDSNSRAFALLLKKDKYFINNTVNQIKIKKSLEGRVHVSWGILQKKIQIVCKHTLH